MNRMKIKFNRQFLIEVLKAMTVPVFCAVIAFIIYYVKLLAFGRNAYGIPAVYVFYSVFGLCFIASLYLLISWMTTGTVRIQSFSYRCSFILMNVIQLLLTLLLLGFFVEMNFPEEAKEGVSVALALVASLHWQMFWLFISICLLPFCKFPVRLFLKSEKTSMLGTCASIIAYILCFPLACSLIWHLCGGRFYLANFEATKLFTMISIGTGMCRSQLI